MWNATVARQCAKTLHDRTIAVLRQLCLDLLTSPFCMYGENSDVSEAKNKSYMHRRITVSVLLVVAALLELGDKNLSACVFLYFFMHFLSDV